MQWKENFVFHCFISFSRMDEERIKYFPPMLLFLNLKPPSKNLYMTQRARSISFILSILSESQEPDLHQTRLLICNSTVKTWPSSCINPLSGYRQYPRDVRSLPLKVRFPTWQEAPVSCRERVHSRLFIPKSCRFEQEIAYFDHLILEEALTCPATRTGEQMVDACPSLLSQNQPTSIPLSVVTGCSPLGGCGDYQQSPTSLHSHNQKVGFILMLLI